MKKIILIPFVFVALIMAGCAITSETTSTTTLDNNPDPTFSQLDQYGTWVDVADYGTVWKPYADPGWQPYSDGQWDWTDQGWMWDSNEPFGWIVYHYGNWQFTDYDGWFWIPGYDWAPARVNWYNSNGYVGWTPVPPPAMGPVVYDNEHARRIWVIVPEGDFVGQNVKNYRNRSNVPDVSVLRSNNGGRAPAVIDVERATNRTIPVVQPTREQVKAGKRQLTRVKVQNNTPVNSSTSGNQSSPVNTREQVNPQKPASNPPENNNRKPVEIINQKPASNQTEINQNKPPENNTVQNNAGSTTTKKHNKNGHHKKGQKKNGAKTPQNTAAPQEKTAPERNATPQQKTAPERNVAPQRAPAPNRTPTSAPVRGNNNSSSQKNDKR
jgi:hypothetical protein